jgi:hypothetical protein
VGEKAAGGVLVRRNRAAETFVIGGLHRSDFEWASKEYEEIGYVMAVFKLDSDGYHWIAVYVKSACLKEKLGGGIFGSKYS